MRQADRLVCARSRAAAWLAAGMLAAAMLASVAPGPVTAQSRPPVPAARPSDPALDAARAAFEALSEAERKGVQDALVWTGDQVGAVDGSFGRQTYEGVIAYQRRLGLAPTGILDPKVRTALLAEGQRLRQDAGFTLVADARTGVQIGIPDKRLPKRGTNPSGGSRWQSADGKITVDTRSVPVGEANLQSLYERNLAIQSPGRQVTYKVLRPEFFVLSGETPTGRFYSRYAAGPDGLRGVSIGYDKSLGKEVERLVIAVANSFNPAPATAPIPNGSPAAPADEPKAQPAGSSARPVFLGTGVFVGPRRVATTSPVETCATARIAGRPARFVERKADGVFVLESEDAADAASLPLRTDPADSDIPVLVLTYAASGDAATLLVAPGTVRGQALSAPLQPPVQGSAVIDRLGHLIGLVSADEIARAAIAGTVPVSRYRISPVGESGPARVGGLGMNETGPEMSAAAVVAKARNAVAPITCGP